LSYARGANRIPEARRNKNAVTANTTVLVRSDALGKWTCNDNNAATKRSNPTSVMSTRLENGSGDFIQLHIDRADLKKSRRNNEEFV
jgi:hypothetical protein